jgi:hypothetical protein
MVSFDPESQIGPNPYAEWSDEDLVTRWNGFERESPAMETELLKRGYLPLHEGLPNRNLVPGDVHELAAAHARGEHEFSLKDNKPIEGCSRCEGDWRNFDGSYWDAHDDAWATIVPDPNHQALLSEDQKDDEKEELVGHTEWTGPLEDRWCPNCKEWNPLHKDEPCRECEGPTYPADPTAPADFLIRTEGKISLLSPLTECARIWVDENISEHIEYYASVVIHEPDVRDILTGIIDDGLSIV